MIARVALCACALWLGCATAPPAQPSMAAAPPASKAAEPAPAAQEPGPPPAKVALQMAQPLGSVRLTGDVAALHAGKPVLFRVQGATPAARNRLAAAHPEARTREDSIAIGPGALPSAVLDRHRAPSFLIDSDQPSVLELARTMPAGIALPELRARIGAHFERIQYGTFWTASRSAKNRAGDCTEHAVLLAAVARALGLPARVVLGYAVLTDEHHGYAFGHAWTEIHDGARWHRIDATPVGTLAVTYVILTELDDEGPGYAISTSELVSILLRTSIDVEAEPKERNE